MLPKISMIENYGTRDLRSDVEAQIVQAAPECAREQYPTLVQGTGQPARRVFLLHYKKWARRILTAQKRSKDRVGRWNRGNY